MNPKRYHRDHTVQHVGTLTPRAYFIPFSQKEDPNAERERSSRFLSLSGEWDFAWFPNAEALELENPSFPADVTCTAAITVPSCWQLPTDRGYDPPNYINQDYPYQVAPPTLPDEIPCGCYKRRFSVLKQGDSAYTLTFEGVAACFYLWLNGGFIGYSEVSHCTSEFDVTGFLKDGENEICVLVLKLCTGSYFEDQDFFRLSGIFRDVYLLRRDAFHIEDVALRADWSERENLGSLSLRLKKPEALDVSFRLYAPTGEPVAEGDADDAEISVESPLLWTPETPSLYTLALTAGNELIAFSVGFRKTEIKNACMYFNGKKIKLRGINRHDTDPEKGYAVDTARMREDLDLLKRANVNAIRTSHYPNDPLFLQLCDEYGFFVIDEADLETHGMGYNYGDWYWDHWAYLCDAPEWREACVDRARRLYERDKNHPCVLMWSLGNESGCGENHRAMAAFIRARDPGAVIHYENAHLEYAARLGKDFSDISDVESRMYASLDYLKSYLDDPAHTKPFFYCEYVSAWSTGDIPLHWDAFEQYDAYLGGCVWELTDHAVNVGTKEKPRYRYGGDFGDYPNDGICCLDGLVFPDRKPRPGYFDMKECYKPFSVVYANGRLRVGNKRFFTDLADCDLVWLVEENGNETASGIIPAPDIAPGKTREYALPVSPAAGKTATLTVFLAQRGRTAWAKPGYILGQAQFILNRAPMPIKAKKNEPLSAEQTRTEIRIENKSLLVIFDRLTGRLRTLNAGQELFTEPAAFSLFRTCSPAASKQSDWERARYRHAYQSTLRCGLTDSSPESTTVEIETLFASPALPPAVRAVFRYTVRADATVLLHVEAAVTENAPPLPRFGLALTLPARFRHMTYFGFGPEETYPDRFRSQRLGLFQTTAEENFVHYVKPTENGAHYGTTYAAVTDDTGCGLAFSDPTGQGFLFNVSPYTDGDLQSAAHNDELQERNTVTVHLDYKMHADNDGHTKIEPWRQFSEKQFSYDLLIAPILPNT